MKYLSISPTVMVSMAAIDAIEVQEDVTKVYVGNKDFDTLIPLSTLVEVLNSNHEESSIASDIRQLREDSQFYGG